MGTSDATVLSTLWNTGEVRESLTTAEVADELDEPQGVIQSRLSDLCDQGLINTKEVGDGVKLWWCLDEHEQMDALSDSEDSSILDNITSEEVLEVVVGSQDLAEYFYDVGDGAAWISFDGVSFLSDGTQLQYYTVEDIDANQLLEVAERFTTIEDARLLSTVGNEVRMEVRTTEDSLAGLVREYGGDVKNGYLENDTFKMTLELPISVDIDDFEDDMQDMYGQMEIHSVELVYSPRLFRSMVKESLTDKQWATLQAAYFSGYFESPKVTSGGEIAETMGVSRQTFHYHLQNAQLVVFNQLFEGTVYDDAEGI